MKLWKEIKEAPRYEICKYVIWQSENDFQPMIRRKSDKHIMKQSNSTWGYYKLSLSTKTKRKSLFSHRIYAKAFLPNPENKPCIDHINGHRKDNIITNLRWVTRAENNRNRRQQKSKTGVCGVTKRYGKYQAKISINNKIVCLGTFTNIRDAELTYLKKKKKVSGEFMPIECEKRLNELLKELTIA